MVLVWYFSPLGFPNTCTLLPPRECQDIQSDDPRSSQVRLAAAFLFQGTEQRLIHATFPTPSGLGIGPHTEADYSPEKHHGRRDFNT
jgi:hypothetical protein